MYAVWFNVWVLKWHLSIWETPTESPTAPTSDSCGCSPGEVGDDTPYKDGSHFYSYVERERGVLRWVTHCIYVERKEALGAGSQRRSVRSPCTVHRWWVVG